MSSPAWSSNSKMLAFLISFDGYPFEIFIAEWKDEKVELAKLKTPKDVHVSKDLIWMPGKSEICFLGEEKARAKVYSINVEDETSRVMS